MTTLRGCLEAAKEAILAGATDRAIDLCFHVLCSYPKNVEAHCLLGEAYREKGMVEQAEDTFRRVLSADPENLVARWALSILQEDKGDAEAAQWELERAFELSPGHEELRSEMHRISQREVHLTKGALGRIYARGELYDRAAQEFRSASDAQPGRLDLLVALGEALWKSGRYAEANSICQQALQDSPDCLKANIIVGHALLASGQKEQGEELLRCAQALDPENNIADQLLDGSSVIAYLTRIEVEIPEFEGLDDLSAALARTDFSADEEPLDVTNSEPYADSLHLSDDLSLNLDIEPLTSEGLAPEELELISQDVSEEPSIRLDFDGIGEEEPAELSSIEDTEAYREGASEVKEDFGEATLLDSVSSGSTSAQGSELQESEVYDEEWNQLLTEDIELDKEAEARINAALAEIGGLAAPPQSSSALESACLKRIAANPEDYEAHIELALIYHRSGRTEEAVKEFELLVKSSPELIDRVIEGLQALLTSNPGCLPAHRALGDAFMKTGRFQQAIDQYNLCLGKR